jgi:membrane protease YdiL (CAAX protease family)
MIETTPVNSFEAIQSRFAQGRIPRFGPMLMLVARSAFILLAQGITFLLFLQLKVPNASVVIRNWWPVYGTLVDIGCLGIMYYLTKREGIRLLDLISLVKSKLKKEVPLGLGLFLLIAPITIFGGGMLAQLIAYGKINPVFPEYTFMRSLPLFALLYARILWWPIWSVTEEMTYNGYTLPRLLALTKSRWISVALVSFFFALQHSFLMLAGFRFGFYMFLAFIPLSIAMVLVFLRIRRLPPMIIAHWLMDLSNVLFMYQVG